MALPATWYLFSERVPAIDPEAEQWSEWVEIVVARGFTERWITVGRYHYASQQWQDRHNAEVYNSTPGFWVTHWRPLPELPLAVPPETIMTYIQALKPDFISHNMPMRVLLLSVEPTDAMLHETYYRAVWRTGIQGTRVYTRGPLKQAQYYIDFYADDALHLRRIKEALDATGAAYTIAPRKKRK